MNIHPSSGAAGESLRVSTPGRVCLFGEHQDYLSLPVIPCAISLRISISGTVTAEPVLSVDMPDIHAHDRFRIDADVPYVRERDYCRSVVNVLRRSGLTFTRGSECRVNGRIPVNAGTSSSSALVVSWVNYLSRMSDQRAPLAPEEIGRLAHAAEVLEFGEPGGMMDQYSTAMGGVIWIGFHPGVRIERLAPPLGTFVLGDSREPKDTKSILAGVKNRVLAIVARLSKDHHGFSIFTSPLESLEEFGGELDASERRLLAGTLENRDITIRARQLLERTELDHRKLGDLLNRHQDVLRDVLGISTPKIDRMISRALQAGALGAKINGSGGGGCMFAYAPEHAAETAEAIERAGGKAYIVHVDRGTIIE